MCQHNYGGIPVGTDENAEGHQVDIVSSWNVAEYLPKTIQVSHSYFIDMLPGLISLILLIITFHFAGSFYLYRLSVFIHPLELRPRNGCQ